jgi:hypothetical protein
MMRRVRQTEWWTGGIPDRSGLSQFTEIIRDSKDPARTPRGQRPTDTMRWRRELKGHPSKWGQKLLEHLKDGTPRTLNRIGVELVDFGADTVLGTALNEALWALVEAGALEFTPGAPVFFRYRGPPETKPDYAAAARRVSKVKDDE